MDQADDAVAAIRHRQVRELGNPQAYPDGQPWNSHEPGMTALPPGELRQEIEAANFYRPRDPGVLAAHVADFPKISLYNFADTLGDWQKAQSTFFADKGVFDQIYKPGQ